jgi:ribosomal protein S18 acetylase RimI-like enzyme
MRVDRLLPGDVAAYRALMLEAYERHPESFTSTPGERRALPLSWWEKRLAGAPGAPHVVFGARDDDGLWGVAGLAFNDGAKTSHKVRLFGMYVDRSRRRAGMADALMDAALAEARARRKQLVQLTVSEGNEAALALYRKRGFREYGLEPRAIAVGDRWVAKVYLWLPLDAADG